MDERKRGVVRRPNDADFQTRTGRKRLEAAWHVERQEKQQADATQQHGGNELDEREVVGLDERPLGPGEPYWKRHLTRRK